MQGQSEAVKGSQEYRHVSSQRKSAFLSSGYHVHNKASRAGSPWVANEQGAQAQMTQRPGSVCVRRVGPPPGPLENVPPWD
ncbi:hypothetical protein AAFF_G00080000 [Aldrovandia affinis]|uniref:Uncharacterized protein n=1 Tax=Aldrovandia affinis TaxID=143900 RepID=A0AAD7T3V6_9TELE|nr:hypothetical protein AAFF_G00080000 [Aldrovandia affinis]